MEGLNAEEQQLFGVAPTDAPLSEEEPSTELSHPTELANPPEAGGLPASPTWPTTVPASTAEVVMTRIEPARFASAAPEDHEPSDAQRGWRRLSPARRLADPYPVFARSDHRRSRSRTTPRRGDSPSSSSSRRRGQYRSESQRSRSSRRSHHSSRRESPEPQEFFPAPPSSSHALTMSLSDVHTLMSTLAAPSNRPTTLNSTQVETSIHINPVTNTATRAFVGPTPGTATLYLMQPGFQPAHAHLHHQLPPPYIQPNITQFNAPETSRSRRRSPSREPRWDRGWDSQTDHAP